jgi:hypothetical protein
MSWLRWHDGTMEDGKWAVISGETGVTVATILGIWGALLESANNRNGANSDVTRVTQTRRAANASVTRVTQTPGTCRHSISFLAKILRVTVTQMTTVVEGMERYGCLTRHGDTIVLVNWNKRQYADATAAERMRRYRDRKKNNPPSENVTVTDANSDEDISGAQKNTVTRRNAAVTVTPSDTDSDSDTDIEKKEREGAQARAPSAPPRRRSNEGHRIPDDWSPSLTSIEYAKKLGLDPVMTAEAFHRHWMTEAGQKARKTNWDLAFLTWCRREVEFRGNRNGGGVGHGGAAGIGGGLSKPRPPRGPPPEVPGGGMGPGKDDRR